MTDTGTKPPVTPTRLRPAMAMLLSCGVVASALGGAPARYAHFLENHCLDCHDDDTQKGELNLAALDYDLDSPPTFRNWVTVLDRVKAGEMPPKKKRQPDSAEKATFLAGLSGDLIARDRQRHTAQGRVVFRRLNRTEYEHTLQDLLALPHLDVREMLPADGEAHGFDTVGEALNLSYVQIANYLEVADLALDKAIALKLPGDPSNQE